MPPFHTETNCPGWGSHPLASDVPAAPTSLCHHTPALALGPPETTGPKAEMGGMQLGVCHPNPAEIPQDTQLLSPCSPSPSPGHHNPAQLTHLQLQSCRAVCDRCPLPATLNTCHGNRRLPQGAFHSGKPHPPYSGSCFRDIPTRANPRRVRGKLRQGGAARLCWVRGHIWESPSLLMGDTSRQSQRGSARGTVALKPQSVSLDPPCPPSPSRGQLSARSRLPPAI